MTKPAVVDVGLEPYPGYRLRRLLGQGGFGSVWEADGPNGHRVALKFLPCEHGLNAAEEQRSVQMVRHLRHPNLICIGDVWCFPGHLVISMELADGTLLDLYQASLDQYGTPLDAECLLPLMGQAADALDFLNTRQHQINDQCVAVQHCDVKPSNLLLIGEQVKVSDFSLTSVTTSQMKFHRRAGTADFMAPEVFQGKLSDRTDQYALAVTYHQLRTGQLPFDPTTFSRGHAHKAPELSELTEAERPIIARALASHPGDRWPSCRHMIAQLCLALNLPDTQFLPDQRPRHASKQLRLDKDRRRSLRHACRMAVSCRLLGKQGVGLWEATLVDVSKRGLGILSQTRLERGAILVIQLGEITERFSQPLLIRVVRLVREGDSWLCGCTFARQLSNVELESLLRAGIPV